MIYSLNIGSAPMRLLQFANIFFIALTVICRISSINIINRGVIAVITEKRVISKFKPGLPQKSVKKHIRKSFLEEL
jgi:hypothetical protein